MESLMSQLHQGQVSHFIILHAMGTLASANVTGIFSFLQPTLINILPTLGMIKTDHVKQAYSFGNYCKISITIIIQTNNK